MPEELTQFLEQIRHGMPPWEEMLSLLSKHYVEVMFVVALTEAFLALIVFTYNRRYLKKIDHWFRFNVLKECSKPSYLLSRWVQVEHLLHTFRIEYVKKLDNKSQEFLKEEYYKLTNETTHAVYSYSKFARTCFNLFFDMIPMFPMLGILGTVVAIACQFSGATETADGTAAILSVTQNFGMAVWTAIYGIVFAVGFTIINAMFIESGTQKCFELEKTAQESLDEVLHIISSRWNKGSGAPQPPEKLSEEAILKFLTNHTDQVTQQPEKPLQQIQDDNGGLS